MRSIDHCLLGLIGDEPRSGYDIRLILTRTPMRRYSDSPGSIYPGLRRLKERGMIKTAAVPLRRRKRTVYGLTPAGRRALVRWLRAPISETDVANQLEEVMLRLSFQHLIRNDASLDAFLRSLENALRSHAAKLRAYIRTQTADYPAGAKLALEAGLDMYETLAKWTERNRKK